MDSKSGKNKAKKSKPKLRTKIPREMKFFVTLIVLVIISFSIWFGIKQISKGLLKSKIMKITPEAIWGGSGSQLGKFEQPWDVALDSNGNIFVTDFSGNRVEEFGPNLKPILEFGKAGKGPGEFNQPSGIFINDKNQVLVCDTFNSRIQEFDENGKFIRQWSHQFFGPKSIVESTTGKVYVVDTGNHQVQVFTPHGDFIRKWGGFGTANGKFREPVGCVWDPRGFLYVADSNNNRIEKFTGNGKWLETFGIPTWHGKTREMPYLAFAHGSLWASNASQNAVLRLSPNGSIQAIYTKANGGFSGAAGIAAYNNEIYVVEKSVDMIASFLIPNN
jgi:DNA-binding beta-propeller fold protein YncE